MSDGTKIEWADATWNPIRGCTKVSEGCRNCYAARMAARFSAPGQPYEGLAEMTPHGPRWTGKIRLVPEVLEKPLRWLKPRRVFVNSMSDLFHEDVPNEFIAEVWNAMRYAQIHTFQIITKRPERMFKWFKSIHEWEGYMVFGDIKPKAYGGNGIVVGESDNWPLPNVWLGVSVDNQQAADERIPLLLQTPAAVRFVSCEPLLGPVDLERWVTSDEMGVPTGMEIDWVIVGGESGPGARPMHPEWVRSIRDQCQAARVPFFFKSWGKHIPYDENTLYNFNGNFYLKKFAKREIDGREWNEMPEVRS